LISNKSKQYENKAIIKEIMFLAATCVKSMGKKCGLFAEKWQQRT